MKKAFGDKIKMKVLIIKLGAIGDVVMALPMIEATKEKYPKAQITWICGKSVFSLLQTVSNLDKIIVVNDSKLLTGNIFEKICALIEIWLKVLGTKFDLVLIGHSDPRYKLLVLTVFKKSIRSFTRNKRFWPVPGRYHSDEYVRLVTNEDSTGLIEEGKFPIVKVPSSSKFDSILKADGSPIIALAPGGAKNLLNDDTLRRWPLENYVELADFLLKKGFKVLLTGASTDQWVLEAFSRLKVINLIGKTDLLELIHIYKMSSLIITHDSGSLHLAGLTGTPIIALFGPTNPFEKVPRKRVRVQVYWEREKYSCCPCYDGRSYAKCYNNICLQGITVEMVYNSVVQMIG